MIDTIHSNTDTAWYISLAGTWWYGLTKRRRPASSLVLSDESLSSSSSSIAPTTSCSSLSPLHPCTSSCPVAPYEAASMIDTIHSNTDTAWSTSLAGTWWYGAEDALGLSRVV